jgi:nucleotide-binding universal stress UspA family protein
MERILVSLDGRHAAWEALARAVSLAARIEARVFVLLVSPPDTGALGPAEADIRAALRRRLELAIEAAKAEGISIDFFMTEGAYEEEVIRFIEHHRITLLVADGGDGQSRRASRDAALDWILHRATCRVELVTPRKPSTRPQRERT